MPTPISPAVVAILADGGLEYGVRSLDVTGDEDVTFARMVRRWWEYPYQAVRSVLNRAIEARYAAAALEQGFGAPGLDVSEIPVNPTLRTPEGDLARRYRYRGYYSYESPNTGEVATRPWAFDSDVQVALADLRAEAIRQYREDHTVQQTDPIPLEELAERYLDSRVHTVQRRY